MAIEARRAWAEMRIVEERLNTLYREIEEGDVEKEKLRVFGLRWEVSTSKYLLDVMYETLGELDKLEVISDEATTEAEESEDNAK